MLHETAWSGTFDMIMHAQCLGLYSKQQHFREWLASVLAWERSAFNISVFFAYLLKKSRREVWEGVQVRCAGFQWFKSALVWLWVTTQSGPPSARMWFYEGEQTFLLGSSFMRCSLAILPHLLLTSHPLLQRWNVSERLPPAYKHTVWIHHFLSRKFSQRKYVLPAWIEAIGQCQACDVFLDFYFCCILQMPLPASPRRMWWWRQVDYK